MSRQDANAAFALTSFLYGSNAPYIEGLLVQHERGRNLDLQLWTLISFELWARVFLDRGARGQACQAA